MKKIACIINPASHNVAKKGSVLRTAHLGDGNTYYDLNDFDILPTMIKTMLSTNPEHIFIEGGDGTVQGVLSHILHHKPDSEHLPTFTILPGGMTNLVAKHVGVKKPTASKIEKIAHNPSQAHRLALPALGLKPLDRTETCYGFLLSTGAMPAATRLCLDKIHTQGIGGASAVRTTLFRVLFGHGPERAHIMKPRDISLHLPDINYVDNHILTIATTLPGLMIGINPFWHTQNGPLKLTWIKGQSQHHIRNIMRLILRPHSKRNPDVLEHNGYQSWSGHEARIKVDSDIVLDGEFLPLRNREFLLFATKPLRFVQ